LLHPRHWPAWIALGLLRGCAALPPRARDMAAPALGALLRGVAISRRRIAARNLALCFPALDHAAREALLRRNIASLARGLIEAAGLERQATQQILEASEVRGLEHLEAARTVGHGVLLVGLHMDSLERAIAALGLRTAVDFVYRRQSGALWDAVLARTRARFVGRLIERHAVRALLRSLHEGRTVWYLPDQDYGARHSVFVPFFGVPAATITATARLARASGAAVVFVAHWREADDRLIVEIAPALESYPSADPVADATRLNTLVQAVVCAHPAQYLWVHRRFKTSPAGTPPRYRG
jgi:KDO2-lipid IV(A) lauroyltransferase